MLSWLFFLLTTHLIGQYLPSFSVELGSSNYLLGDQRLHHIPSDHGSSPTVVSWHGSSPDEVGSSTTVVSWQVATVDNGTAFKSPTVVSWHGSSPDEVGSSTTVVSWQATVDNGTAFKSSPECFQQNLPLFPVKLGTTFDYPTVVSLKEAATVDDVNYPIVMSLQEATTVDDEDSFGTSFKATVDESDLFQNFVLSFCFVMQSGIISTISLVGLCRIHRRISWKKRQSLYLDGIFCLVNLLPALPTTMWFIAAFIVFVTFAYKFTFEKKSNHCRPRHYSLIQKCQSRFYQSVNDKAKVGAGVLCIPTGQLFLDSIRLFICSFANDLDSNFSSISLIFSGVLPIAFITTVIGGISTNVFLFISNVLASAFGFVVGKLTQCLVKLTPDEKILTLFIKANETLSFRVGENETVEQIKRMVGAKLGIDFRLIRLTYGSKDLVDKFHLASYFLPDQATLHLSIRILGGSSDKKVCASQICCSIPFSFTIYLRLHCLSSCPEEKNR
jgi:hypothetical protein